MSLQKVNAAGISNSKPAEFPWKGKKAVLLFGAAWHEACPPLEQVLDALASTAEDPAAMYFGSLEAEDVSEVAERYGVSVVPTVVALAADGSVFESFEGVADPSLVTLGVQRLITQCVATGAGGVASSSSAADGAASQQESLSDRLDRLIRGDQVMLFMKGKPDAPRCGFSRQAVELLEEQKVAFGSFDILSDDTVRQGLKKHSDWPTYPQFYVKGELVGGLDIVKEMIEDGPLAEQWEVPQTDGSTVETLQQRLEKLTKQHKVMLFMKGLPSAPKCGFSRKIVELLESKKIAFDAFDILEDEEVRQGLKEFSKWPTFPQLYVNGDLVGGLDICLELDENDEFMDMLE
uniref:Glutaredoxin domain-containing protein n=1 Tax=Craspedostauros australis TaxID=1486917 RepID=A0A6T6EQF6_9STRA|mmetsp:Transcript_16311/g.45223  ORF Transcript_16311/g.45223 Transcript_16311/m.45223 type:complete len:348 (+) Transcript_16311:111-1154(+)|eukprot:CAMPEP_0198136018 /NCGR_PEP_ID=MMETSP1442-20131203/60891_1 /TAXON_ID= /ORGANISM="Craspedostauros australis, Strain CCMP3328" /LENGTH=347 /DNA_ID=CAMNT_0043797211 /DNA_START=63 /DNA_END=1106 /DNA_ORIENTATION=-